jgi:hypothetical protein
MKFERTAGRRYCEPVSVSPSLTSQRARVRIPFPDYIPLTHTVLFASLLLAVQLIEGTNLAFAIYCFLFIVTAGVAFNIAGGFSRPSGAYIFFYALLGVIVGLCWKAILKEPGDSNLLVPVLTMQVFLGGMVSMLLAAFFSRKLSLRRPILGSLVTDDNMQNATIGCLVTGLIISVLITVLPRESGGFLSAIAQVNRFLPMAVILGVIHQIRRTGGRSSINLPVLIAMAAIFAWGLLGFSKEGIFTPLACWVIAIASQGFRLSRIQAAAVLVIVFLMMRYLVPYSQYGRNFRSDTLRGSIATSVDFLGRLEEVREEDRKIATESHADNQQSYYNTPQGFVDRLQMIGPDDSLIDLTERSGTFGLSPIYMGFGNLVPHFLWPGKPSINFGNLYAHELGGLSAEDFTTGISFTPSGDAYHMARWLGIFLIAPALWFLLFFVFDSLCGDTRSSPWGLLMIAVFAHLAPEGMLAGVIYSLGYVTFGLVMAALAAAYVMPIVGSLIKGPEQIRILRTAAPRSISRSSLPTAAAAGPEE